MLRESKDQKINDNLPKVRIARKLKAEEVTDEIISTLENRHIRGSPQTGRSGLGNGNFRPFKKMPQHERRTAASGQVKNIEAQSGMSISSSVHTKGR